MKIFKITYRFAVAASVMLLAFSCNQNELDLPSSTVSLRLGGFSDVESPLTRSGETVFQERLSEDLWFTATVSDNPVSTDVLPTKGKNTKESDFSTLYGTNGFKVYAENQSDSTECLFNNEIFTLSGTEWVPGTSTNWPAYVSDWYCWAPNSIATLTKTDKTFTYTTPASNTTSDTDILVSTVKDVAAGKNSTLDITFKHALCEVKFVSNSGIPAGTLDSLCINGINLTGTYDFDNETWGNQTNPGSISLKTSLAVTAGTTGQALTDSTQTFFVIPQTVGTGASLSVKYNGGTKHVIDLSTGFDFPAGKLVTFSLGEAEFTFELADPDDGLQTFEETDNVSEAITHTISVKSDLSAGDEQYADWEIESYQIGTAAAVSVNGPNFTAGDYTVSKTDNNTLTVTSAIRAAENYGDNAHWTSTSHPGGNGWTPEDWSGGHLFKDEGPYGDKSHPIDLSRLNYYQDDVFGAKQSPFYSANTYIIRHAGTYKLPLVYGNSIHDAQPNPNSYRVDPPISVASSLNNFKNFLGKDICKNKDFGSFPFIENDSECVADGCAIIWEQNSGVISNLKIIGKQKTDEDQSYWVEDTDKATQVRYLQFTVEQSTICQNNALICIYKDLNNNSKYDYDQGETIWSWHIWTTNDPALINEPFPVTNSNNVTYDFFPLNSLGWTDGSVCPSRDDVQIVLRQKDSGKQLTIDVKCPQMKIAGSCAYYQYGRKDPMFAGKYTSVTSPAHKISEGIAYPATFYASNANDWCNESYNNLWTAQCDPATSGRDHDNTMFKTIYDPSPVGYRVPAPNAFLPFNNAGINFDNFGWEFEDDNKATIYFPAPPYIENSKGSLDGSFGLSGRYGTIGLTSSGSALYFKIDKYTIQPNNQHARSNGTAIRPVCDITSSVPLYY